jgi:hypothetical protein
LTAEAFAPGLHAEYRIANAPMQGYPYQHFYLRDVFPQDYYSELQRNLPDPAALMPIEQSGRARGYPERSIMMLGGEKPAGVSETQFQFWQRLAQWIFAGRLGNLVIGKFGPVVDARMQDAGDVEIIDELMLVHDRTRYSLGPHTDSPAKVISLLFYLPADERRAQLGTSIYVPKERGFTCPGGTHYPFERFDRVATMPFLPNSLFGFVRTNNSFHGVEPLVEPDAGRWLLLHDLRLRKAAPGAQAPAPAAGPRVEFKF